MDIHDFSNGWQGTKSILLFNYVRLQIYFTFMANKTRVVNLIRPVHKTDAQFE